MRRVVGGSRIIRETLYTLDALGLTTRTGRRGARVLTVPVEEAARVLRGVKHPLDSPTKRQHIRHKSTPKNIMTVVWEPECLFKPGARFPRQEVLVSDPHPNEWNVGTVMHDRSTGQYYKYDGLLWQEIDAGGWYG